MVYYLKYSVKFVKRRSVKGLKNDGHNVLIHCIRLVYTELVYTELVYTELVYTELVYTEFVYTELVLIRLCRKLLAYRNTFQSVT